MKIREKYNNKQKYIINWGYYCLFITALTEHEMSTQAGRLKYGVGEIKCMLLYTLGTEAHTQNLQPAQYSLRLRYNRIWIESLLECKAFRV